MSATFYIPSVNLIGVGALDDAVEFVKTRGFHKPLIVTDEVLVKIGMVDEVKSRLEKHNLAVAVFDKAQPNPTTKNVTDGLVALLAHQADVIITLGGGSPHDCGKGIALLATNGGDIRDYEGVDRSAKPQLPLVAINTTAGTASEMTRFCIITDEKRHVKMAIVDKHVTPIASVNDPVLMMKQPASLTAATGMDALTHAVEAYVSTAATPLTDALALKAIEMVVHNLPQVVKHGDDVTAREAMAYAQFMAGCAFNNASLGYVHAMAHQLGGLLNLPHGICNAVLLPHVQRFNAKAVAPRLGDIAQAMGVDTKDMGAGEAAEACIVAIERLSATVGTNRTLTELGVREEHIAILAENALKDACGFTNPIKATHEEICIIFRMAM